MQAEGVASQARPILHGTKRRLLALRVTAAVQWHRKAIQRWVPATGASKLRLADSVHAASSSASQRHQVGGRVRQGPGHYSAVDREAAALTTCLDSLSTLC
jgi:hypothetical protein